LEALDAEATPTRSATKTRISAIVVALVTIAAETVAMNARVLRIRIILPWCRDPQPSLQ